MLFCCRISKFDGRIYVRTHFAIHPYWKWISNWPRFWPTIRSKIINFVGLIWKTFISTLVWPLKGPTFAISTKNKRVLTWAAQHLNRKLQLILIQLHNSSFCNVIMFYILDDKLVVRQPLVINPVIFIIKPVNTETATSSKTCRAGVEDNAMSVSQRVTWSEL